MRVDAVEERPSRIRHWHRADLDPILPRHIAVMKDYPLRNAEATLGPGRGQRQIHFSGKRVREVVKHERGLVREDSRLLGPKPDRRKVLVLTGRKVNDSIDASPNPSDAPILHVLEHELRGVAGLGRLLRGELALLADRELKEAVPVRSRRGGRAHDTKGNLRFSFVKHDSKPMV